MKLKVMPQVIEAAYEFLSKVEPFKSWNLPDAEDVTFKIMRSNTYGACHARKHKKPIIWISTERVATINNLLLVTAHEMIHLYQGYHGMKQTSHHDESFRLLWAQVAVHCGFDPKGL